MKTLLLMSSGSFLESIPDNLFDKPLSEMKIAHVITATKDVPSLEYLEQFRTRVKELGLNIEDVDIEGKNEEQLRELFFGKMLFSFKVVILTIFLKPFTKAALKR